MPEEIATGAQRYWLVLAGRGFGKALALDTPIPTPIGWTTMAAISDGDQVFAEDGSICRVVKAHNVMIGRPCVEVAFSDGSRITCDEDHLWLTWDQAARKSHGRAENPTKHPQVRTAAEIRDTLFCNAKGERNHSVAACGVLHGSDISLPVDPYTLGAWLGDGATNEASITTPDLHIIRRIETAGYETEVRAGTALDTSPTFVLRQAGAAASRKVIGGKCAPNTGLRPILKQAGVFGDKHIPSAYMRASAKQRLALLQGLMDTDGYCDENGKIEFCSTSRRLADGVAELARSFGIIARVSEGRAVLDGRDLGPKFRVYMMTEIPVFSLPRKAQNLRPDGRQSNRRHHRYITDVRPVPSRPVRCITVDSPSRLYLCGEAMIPTHNTRMGAETVREWVKSNEFVNLAGATRDDARDIMVEGESGILAICPPGERPQYKKHEAKLVWPNGATSLIFTADEPERFRGKQHQKLWADELCAWRYPDAWTQAKLGLRLPCPGGPQAIITTTPKPSQLIRDLIDDDATHITAGTTYDNAANLDAEFYASVIKQYEGSRLGRQELLGELLEDTPGALWRRSNIDANRREWSDIPPLRRIVVAIDPATSTEEKSDETGIVAAGLGEDGRGYLLADVSGKFSPAEWAKRAVDLFERLDADRIVAEKNQGGEMVEATIRTAFPGAPIKLVHASRGKAIRAEPIATLYEQNRISHVGTHGPLEDQMCVLTSDFDRNKQGVSPDRLDAMVWAFTELFPRMVRPGRRPTDHNAQERAL